MSSNGSSGRLTHTAASVMFQNLVLVIDLNVTPAPEASYAAKVCPRVSYYQKPNIKLQKPYQNVSHAIIKRHLSARRKTSHPLRSRQHLLTSLDEIFAE